MNKTFIIFLAVCLISVHAFVKREAEKTNENELGTLAKGVENIAESIVKELKPENLMKQLGEAIDNAKKVIEAFGNE